MDVTEPSTLPGEVHRDRIAGIILGTAVGDALGLPREGLSARRAARIHGKGGLRHTFLLGRGMCSDDTEHTCMVAQAWLASGGDIDRFAKALAWQLRWWLLGIPAGVGFGTLRAGLKLWLGFSPARSGVHSAGNGPAMRSAILAACTIDRPDSMANFVRASTRITHTDVRAEQGALAVALAAQYSLRYGKDLDTLSALDDIRGQVIGHELQEALAVVRRLAANDADAPAVCQALGMTRGVSGFVNHTVPVALFCWCRWPADFRTALEKVVALGGDTDTTAAITGAMVGAVCGASGIPSEWVNGLIEWPRSVPWMRRLADALVDGRHGGSSELPTKRVPLQWPALIPRNLVFAGVVMAHGFRRLLPPY